MKHIFTYLVLSCFWTNINAQIAVDTAQIAIEINNIKTKDQAKKYLAQIWEDDQNHRGRLTNDTIDIINLFKTSYYINRFGYPSEFGDLSVMPWHVHRHVDNTELRKLTLSIIWEANKKKVVTEKHLKQSIFGVSCTYEDIIHFEQTPLKVLMQDLNLTISKVISIETMVKTLGAQLAPVGLEKLSEWKADDTVRTYELNGKPYTTTFEGHSIELFTDEDDSIYFRTLLYTTGELRKLKQLEPNVYSFEDCEKDRLVIDENSLKYMNGARIVWEYWTVENFK